MAHIETTFFSVQSHFVQTNAVFFLFSFLPRFDALTLANWNLIINEFIDSQFCSFILCDFGRRMRYIEWQTWSEHAILHQNCLFFSIDIYFRLWNVFFAFLLIFSIFCWINKNYIRNVYFKYQSFVQLKQSKKSISIFKCRQNCLWQACSTLAIPFHCIVYKTCKEHFSARPSYAVVDDNETKFLLVA